MKTKLLFTSMVIFSWAVSHTAAHGQATPAQRLREAERQRRFFQALQFQQFANRQLLYPTPLSGVGNRLGLLQMHNQFDRAANLQSLRAPGLSAAESAEVNAILQRAQAVQFGLYPQTASPATMPLNFLQLDASRALGLENAFPQFEVPVITEEFVDLLFTQRESVNAVGAAATAVPGLISPKYSAPFQFLQGLADEGLKRVGRKNRKQGGRGGAFASRFRQVPGERELELGRLWLEVDKDRARTLLRQAVARAGGETDVGKAAQEELVNLAQ